MAEAISGIAGYVRLSREEVAEKGATIEQKLSLRRSILVTIARHKGIALPEDQITCELRSGATLDQRPGLLDILERCRRRELHTVVAFDVDRLTRDVADLKVIANAFFRGEVTLITQRDAYHFDRTFDPTVLQISAVLGEKERRSFNERRIATNDQRTRQGELSVGYAAYGYRWDKTRRAFSIDPAEYAIVEEVFRRFWDVGAYTIAHDLNARGIPPPSKKKRSVEFTAHEWLTGTVSSIARNPFYAGRLAKRHEVDREGVVSDLPASKWIMNEQPIPMVDADGCPAPFIHPVSWEDWQRLQERSRERYAGAPTRGLLTGILYCAHGSPMRKQGPDIYTCGCRQKGNRHRAWCIQRATVEGLVWGVVEQQHRRVVEDARKSRAKPIKYRAPRVGDSMDRLQVERAEVNRDISEKEATMNDLINRSSFYISLPGFGIARHEQALRTIGKEVEDLRARVEAINARLITGPVRATSDVLIPWADHPELYEHIEELPFAMQTQLIKLVVEAIRLERAPEGRVRTPAITVSLYAIGNVPAQTQRLEIVSPMLGKKRSG